MLVAPWRLAFNDPSTGLFRVLEILIDIIYVADLVLGFFTGYVRDHSNTYERSLALITQRYTKRWLVTDAVAAFPWSAATLRPLIGHSWVSTLQSVKGLKLVPLFWYSEVHAFGIHISYTMLTTIKTVAIVLISAHLLSCVWFYITCHPIEYGGNRHEHPEDDDDENSPHSWLFCGEEGNGSSQYLSAFYFIIYTMMTVGYGDVIPRGDRQMVLAIFIEVLGVMLFAFIIATMQRFAQLIDPVSQANTSNLSEISVSCIPIPHHEFNLTRFPTFFILLLTFNSI